MIGIGVVLLRGILNPSLPSVFQLPDLGLSASSTRIILFVCHPSIIIIIRSSMLFVLFPPLPNTQLFDIVTVNRRFPEITGKDNLTPFSYSGRVKSPEWRRQLRRADLRQF